VETKVQVIITKGEEDRFPPFDTLWYPKRSRDRINPPALPIRKDRDVIPSGVLSFHAMPGGTTDLR
jgi:hypothetical protein